MRAKTIVASVLMSTLCFTTMAWAQDPTPGVPPGGSPPPAAAPPTAAELAAPPVSRAHDDFREPGRFGVVGAVTDDGFQFGLTRVDEHFEAVFTLDAAFAALGSSTAVSAATGDIGLTLRLGPRFALGHLNYVSFGAQGHVPVAGKDNGVSTAGSFSAGPYIGVHRNFAGTPLMISLWVLPYEFAHDLMNDGSGQQVALDQHRFFQAGGFGLAYLF